MECNLKTLLGYAKLHSLQIINFASISCSNNKKVQSIKIKNGEQSLTLRVNDEGNFIIENITN
jgi:hypothetical protein